jgi:hypothetical protein
MRLAKIADIVIDSASLDPAGIHQMLLANTVRKPIAHRIFRICILVWPPPGI